MNLIKSCQFRKVYLVLTITFALMTVRTLFDFDPASIKHSQGSSSMRSMTGRMLALTVEDLCDGVDFKDEVENQSSGSSAANAGVDYFKQIKGDDNKLKKALDKNDSYSTTDYLVDMIPYVAPWAALAVLSLIGWICYTFIVCCPCCKCCKSRPHYTRGQKRCPGIFLLIFSVAALGSGLAGIIVGSEFIPHVKLTECAIVQFSDRFQNGKDQWIGTKKAVTLLDKIDTELADFQLEVTAAFGTPAATAWLDTDSDALDTQLTAISTAYDGGISVISPADGVTNISVEIVGLVPGWNGSSAALVEVIQAEKEEVINPIIPVMKNIHSKAFSTSTSVPSIRDQIKSGKSSMNDFIDQIDDMQDQVLKYIEQGDSMLDTVGLILLAIFGVCVFAACLAIAGILLVGLCGIRKFRICNHCSWCWSSFIMIFLFLLATIMIPIGIVFTDFCEIFSDVLASKEELLKYDVFEDVADKFTVCLHGNGDLKAEFLEDDLDFASELETLKAQMDELETTLKKYSGFVSIAGASAVAQGVEVSAEIEKISYKTNSQRTGWAQINSDGYYHSTTAQTVYNTLDTFNTDLKADTYASCTNVDDEWVFDKAACTQTYSAVLSVDSSTGSYCFAVAEHTEAEFNSRYYTGAGNCGGTANLGSRFGFLKAYYNSWVSNIAAPTNAIYKGDNKPYTANAYETNAVTFIGLISENPDAAERGDIKDVNIFFTSIEALLALINDELLPGLNCIFLKQTFKDLEYAMCDKMIPSVFQIGICAALSGIFLIFATIANVYAVKRFGKTAEEDSTKPY
eukprot:CAMPEP_0115020974 /NCGR_PEP_ID=MMETSP0216-20121206/30556_1 /TAXON_ID=223996 /ORGANISM="Protocruzia adherens, Strain Boccale" /LENGTH=796 /DNA_ID=CAMNT_0002393133 /DNA_START=239 /DNA_END=2629 /DNA_ORIENTATION=+